MRRLLLNGRVLVHGINHGGRLLNYRPSPAGVSDVVSDKSMG
jgi:hypothetical protein